MSRPRSAMVSQPHLELDVSKVRLAALSRFSARPHARGGFVIHDEETLTSTDDGDQIHVSLDAEACRPARMGWSTRSSARIS
jgi:hypothetical protein